MKKVTKKITTMLICTLMVFSCLNVTLFAEIGVLIASATNVTISAGDINGDGTVNNKDLTRLMKHISGENVYVVEALLDTNGDSVVNNKDLTRLMKHISGDESAYLHPAIYTVIFKNYDGTVLDTQKVVSGQSAKSPSNPNRDGYVFTGWDKSFTNITNDLIVTAQYKEVSSEKYTVTFVDYDGSTITTKSVSSGEVVELPENPSKSGTTFLGWSGNYVNVTKNETVKAIYSDTKNVFIVESTTGSVDDTITVLVTVDGSVKTCGFDFNLFYDPALELVSYDNDLDLDIIVNDAIHTNGVKLNFSSASDKTKQRDVIELTFRIKHTTKTALPITIGMTDVFEVSSTGEIKKVSYAIVDGVITVK